MPKLLLTGSAVGLYCAASVAPVVTSTSTWSVVPSGYVTVTGTFTVPGVVPSGNDEGSSTVTCGCGPSVG